jgi:hypothetical protein
MALKLFILGDKAVNFDKGKFTLPLVYTGGRERDY